MSKDRGEPFAIVTDSDIVTGDVYKQYSMKEGNGDTSPTNQLDDDLFTGQYGNRNIVKPLYNPSQLAGLLEINTYHNRCVRTKAHDITGNGYKLKKTTEEPDEENKKRLKKFFDEQFPPLEDILSKGEIDYGGLGYSFYELVKEGNLDNTVYKYMNHAPAHTIRTIRDKTGGEVMKFVQKRAGKFVYFKHPFLEKDVHKETGKEYKVGELKPEERANDMIMMKNYTPRSDYYGIPDIINALGAIWGNLAQQSYNNEFFKNHGVPQYAVYITGDYDLETDEEGKPKVVSAIEESLAKVRKNPHSSLVFGIPSSTSGMGENVKVTFEPLAVETKDASFRMFRKDNRDEVIVAHAVPGNRIGIGDVQSLGGDTAYETNRIYKESVLNPRQKEIEDYINRYIVQHNFGIYDWEFKLNSIDVDSIGKDIEVLGFLFENGAATPNDLIRNLGEDYGIQTSDSENMNKFYINGQPVDKINSEPTAPSFNSIEKAEDKDVESFTAMLKNRLNKKRG